MKAIRQIGSLAFVLGLFTCIFAGVPWHVITSDDPVVPWWLRIAVFSLLGGFLVVMVTVALQTKKITKIFNSRIVISLTSIAFRSTNFMVAQ